MRIAKCLLPSAELAVGCVMDEQLVPLSAAGRLVTSLTELLEAADPPQWIEAHSRQVRPVPLQEVTLLPPIDAQEVWAAGVTYKRSRTARMEESSSAASCYDRVYVAQRPELFFKGTAHRVAGHRQPLRIRRDSNWNVPEPELTLVLNSRLELAGFTIGNDMSSRDIEGENPLYLPQAKVYDQSCGLGPWITLAYAMPPRNEIGIHIQIRRGGDVVFQGNTGIDQMARPFEELIGWLGRDNSFPQGAFLLTGTGIVPGSDFTLHVGDQVDITIDGIGTLSNPVFQGA